MSVLKDNLIMLRSTHGYSQEELAEKIDAALKKLKDSGEYDKIYAKWFGDKK